MCLDAASAAILGAAIAGRLQADFPCPLLIPCDDRAGTVLAALAAGGRHFVYTGPERTRERLRGLVAPFGGTVAGAVPPDAVPFDAWAGGTPTGSNRYANAPGLCKVRAKIHHRARSDAMTARVKEILSWYEGENPGVKASMYRMLMHGRLAGTGKLVILPVDQGYEHGPARSFAANPAAYDPHYLYQLGLEAGLSAYAAPLGPLEQGADTFAGQIPLILKMNSANSLSGKADDQALTASVKDALRLGCVGVGFTIYPGSDRCYDMMEELREIIREARAAGLMAVVWSYPRGGKVSKAGETALDIVAYAAHMAALMGAHVIKVKPPKSGIDLDSAKAVYEKAEVPMETLKQRVEHVVQTAFNGKRIVVFSGGDAKDTEGLLREIEEIRDGGGFGSIIGRNSFQRSKEDALDLLGKIIDIYKAGA